MMLEQEFWEVFCVASRNIIMLFIAMVSCWIVVLTLLEKRRKVWPVVAYNIGKLIFSAGIVSLVLDHYYGETLWHKLLVLGLAMVTVVLDFTFYHYVFQCELLKLMIMVFISELFGAAVMEVSLLVLNLLEKSREVVALDIPISWMDLWIFPISAVLFSILYFPLRPLMLKFRNYRLSHRKIWATVFGIYFLGSFGSRFVDVWNSTDVYLFWYLFVLLGLVVVFTAGVLFLGKRGKVRAERDYLLLKQELLESHYTALQMQACRMETERALIGQQIRKLHLYKVLQNKIFLGENCRFRIIWIIFIGNMTVCKPEFTATTGCWMLFCFARQKR